MNARRTLLFALLGVLLLSSTAAATPSPTRVHFTAAGDYGRNTTTTAAVLETIRSTAPDLNLALGDLSYDAPGTEQKWCDFVTSRVGAGFPFQLLSGNHESDGTNGHINNFSACLPNQLPGVVGTYGRQYYVDVPQDQPLVRYLMISPGLTFPEGPTDYSAGSAAYDWTEKAIDQARADGIEWIVVGMHKPCLSVGKYTCDVGADIVHLLMQKRVDLVLSGHEHNYQRTKQLALGVGCTSLTIGGYNPACVRDDDDDLVAGAGTVFQTIGTGGVGHRDITLDDPEMEYFDKVAGANLDPTFGIGDFVVTPDVLTVSFVRAAGGTLSDSFTLTRPTTPEPNEAPTAAFTTVTDGLQASLDGSSSTDADGAVVAHRWDFGDGHRGFGATPQHVYDAPGTYDVTLTVTDEDGASSSTVQPVTVEGPALPLVLAEDAFERSVLTGWGSADAGGAWTASKTTSVSGGKGQLTMRVAGGRPTAHLNGVTGRDVETTVEWSLDKLPAGTGAWVYQSFVTRQSTAGLYKAVVRVSATGALRASFKRTVGSDVMIGSEVLLPMTYAAGDVLEVRTQTVGVSPTTLRLKVWKKGTAEPAGWSLVRTDATPALEAPGSVGLFSLLPSAVTNAPVQAAFDDFRVEAIAPPM